ncbi:MAG: M48 family metallopeptidase [Oligoflexia bacterium]|nr:M48 family metallopeptidase [Oligoflexia bacterium]
MPIFGSYQDQYSGGAYPRRGFKLFPIILFALFALFYYFSHQEEVPLTGRRQLVGIDPQTEMALGLQSYEQVLMQSQVVQAGPQVDLVRSVGERIARATENESFDWQFAVIDSEQVNAFCLPGGKVAVYTGILPVAHDAAGLAVVLGHEIAHAIARHGAERMAHEQLAQYGQLALGMAVNEMDPERRRAVMGAFGLGAQFGILLPFSRKHESEADYMGLIYMARACFDPEEAPRFWERMEKASAAGQPLQFMSTHPSHETRVEQLRSWMPAALAEKAKYCN